MGVELIVGGFAHLLVLSLIIIQRWRVCEGGLTSSYVRANGISADMPLDSDVFQLPPGYNAPQQVHITQGDHEGRGVIVSWITPDEEGSTSVLYWAANSLIKKTAHGRVVRYKFHNYSSGYIHHCTINNLEFDTKYYYFVGSGNLKRQFWFVTPPRPGPDVPYTFGLIGDLGQTHDSNRTVTHYEMNPAKGQTILYLGDLSYADSYPLHDNTRWDTWARFVERNVAYQPWIWSAGNHEIDFLPEVGETIPFKPYTHRYLTPYEASGSTSPLWYSIKRASAYIIVLSSYSAYGMYTPQYKWFMNELTKVNRSETPWLIVIMHCPLYSSYVHHYMEGETMRVMYEKYLVQYKVDVVFSGHVHAYERTERISNIKYNVVNGLCTPISDESAPVYLTIGDGGNQEGLLTEYVTKKFKESGWKRTNGVNVSCCRMTEPQPEYSAYREGSYGHGIFSIKNASHAHFGWHRNQDGLAVEADSLWFVNRYWRAMQETSSVV